MTILISLILFTAGLMTLAMLRAPLILWAGFAALVA